MHTLASRKKNTCQSYTACMSKRNNFGMCSDGCYCPAICCVSGGRMIRIGKRLFLGRALLLGRARQEVWDGLEIGLGWVWDTPGIGLGWVWERSCICLGYVWDLSQTYPRPTYPRRIPHISSKTYPRPIADLPQAYPRFISDLSQTDPKLTPDLS